MKKLRILYYLLFIFLIFELIYCDNEELNLDFFKKFTEIYKKSINEDKESNTKNNDSCIGEISYLNNTYEDIYLGNIKILEIKNEKYIFRNFPRKNTKISATFTLYNENKTCFESWPKKENNENTFYSDEFISVVDFEFDNEDNIYILDEGNKSIIIYKYNVTGSQLNKIIIDHQFNISNLVLSDFVIDQINNYFYIAYSYDNVNNASKYGIIKNNMKNDSNIIKIVLNFEMKKYDEEYKLKNKFINNYFNNDIKKYINIALSCDGQVLFLSLLSSKKIFSIPTEYIITQDKEKFTINEAYKNDLSFSIKSGNLGNLYLAGIEKHKIYIAGQIDNDLSIFDYRGLNSINTYDNCSYSKISINNGVLYFICKTLMNDNNENITLVTIITNRSIEKEKSYVYKCAGLNYKWDLKSYIIWGLFSLILCFVLVFVFIENKQDKDINKKNN